MSRAYLVGLGIAWTVWAGLVACSGKPSSGELPKESQAVQQVEISVGEDGYHPSTIHVSEGRPVELIFELKQPSVCLEEVVIDAVNVRRKLVVGENVSIRLDGLKTGVYDFHCGMNMAFGKIVVK